MMTLFIRNIKNQPFNRFLVKKLSTNWLKINKLGQAYPRFLLELIKFDNQKFSFLVHVVQCILRFFAFLWANKNLSINRVFAIYWLKCISSVKWRTSCNKNWLIQKLTNSLKIRETRLKIFLKDFQSKNWWIFLTTKPRGTMHYICNF